MQLLFLHLSDIHIKEDNKREDFHINKIVEALNSLGKIDECIIVVSGDITNSGKINEFRAAGRIMGGLVKDLRADKFKNSYINVVVVPGNHDLELINTERSHDKIIDSFRRGEQDLLVNEDLRLLENFYYFANYNKCFTDDKIVSNVPVYFKKHNLSINFTLINTAIFSLKGSSNVDMGIHYLSKDDLNKLKYNCYTDLNIVVMHHSVEWYKNSVKEDLKKIINSKYSIIFEGHEHDGFGESRNLNDEASIVYMQGNSLSGDGEHEKGFITLLLDTDNKNVIGNSFVWKDNSFYKPTPILNEKLPNKTIKNFEINKNIFKISKDFENFLRFDDNYKEINNYFVFPSLDYSVIEDEKEIEKKVLDDIDKLIELVLNNDRLIISGESRCGKTTMAKALYEKLLCFDYNIMPLYLESEDFSQKRLKHIDNIIERAFNDQYIKDSHSYERYLQLKKEQRLLIIDDASKLDKLMLDKILHLLDDNFGKVIVLSEDKFNIDIKDSVEEALVNKKICKIYIRPFLYDKRKELISKVYCKLNQNENKSKFKKEINNINNKINSHIRNVRLDPEFISFFVTQFADNNYSINQGNNIFNMVYENSIKNKLIQNAATENVKGIFNVLAEIAYEMHFKKLTWIDLGDITIIVDSYNKKFRQKIKTTTLLRIGQDARLLVTSGNRYKFKDKNLKAYFVAQALNKKYNEEDENIHKQLVYVLDNLCFSINSDIMLFMAMITNNTKIINLILKSAADYFNEKEEFSFDSKNISFIFDVDFSVKNNVPNEDEKKDKEKALTKYEEEIKYSEVIELIDEYDYDEKEVEVFANRIYKAIKYLEIVSNILPSFSNDIVAKQQDEIVKGIYTYPNKLIYEWLIDIDNDFDNVANELYEKLNEMRKEKNIASIHMETVKRCVGQMGIYIILNLYQMVSNLSSTKDTLDAINDFDLQNNTNYKLMNLMMIEKSGDFKEYSTKAIELYDKTNIKLIESMVKLSVRNYLLNNDNTDIRLLGDGQSFLDKFFGSSETLNNPKIAMKRHIAKRKIKGQ
jgi:3',5'-cyclic AMP phosphodiesterase CpdA/adenylate kinase family enzyme